MPQECLCDRCTALCCRYFALEIDAPTTPEEFDDVRWYLAHEAVHVFIEEGEWYLAIQTKCQYLRDDNRCGIYEDRPKICREYSTDNCDYHVGAYEFEQYFTSPEQLEAYAQATLGKAYERYVMRQRMKNVGLDPRKVKKGHPKRPKKQDVLASRLRGHVILSGLKGHPSHRPHLHEHAPAKANGGATVELSISAKSR